MHHGLLLVAGDAGFAAHGGYCDAGHRCVKRLPPVLGHDQPWCLDPSQTPPPAAEAMHNEVKSIADLMVACPRTLC